MTKKKASDKYDYIRIALVVLVLLLLLALLTSLFKKSTAQVKDFLITNVTDTTTTIIWTTEEPTVGTVSIARGNDLELKNLSFLNGNTEYYDDRDVIEEAVGEYVVKETGLKDRHTHHVTVHGLNPGTTYYFEVQNDSKKVELEKDSFKTSRILDSIKTPDAAYGRVYDYEGEEFDDDGIAIVYLDDNQELSQPVSSVFNESGAFSLDVANIRKADFLDPYSNKDAKYDLVFVWTKHGELSKRVEVDYDQPIGQPGREGDLLQYGSNPGVSPETENVELSQNFNPLIVSVNAQTSASAADCGSIGTEDAEYGECCGEGKAREIRRCKETTTGAFYYKYGSCVHEAAHCTAKTDEKCNSNGIRDCQGYSTDKCESGVDCGNGPCGSCASKDNGGKSDHCSNGKKDDGLEEGTDCGGACPSCGGNSIAAANSGACPPGGCSKASGGGGGTGQPVAETVSDSVCPTDRVEVGYSFTDENTCTVNCKDPIGGGISVIITDTGIDIPSSKCCDEDADAFPDSCEKNYSVEPGDIVIGTTLCADKAEGECVNLSSDGNESDLHAICSGSTEDPTIQSGPCSSSITEEAAKSYCRDTNECEFGQYCKDITTDSCTCGSNGATVGPGEQCNELSKDSQCSPERFTPVTKGVPISLCDKDCNDGQYCAAFNDEDCDCNGSPIECGNICQFEAAEFTTTCEEYATENPSYGYECVESTDCRLGASIGYVTCPGSEVCCSKVDNETILDEQVDEFDCPATTLTTDDGHTIELYSTNYNEDISVVQKPTSDTGMTCAFECVPSGTEYAFLGQCWDPDFEGSPFDCTIGELSIEPVFPFFDSEGNVVANAVFKCQYIENGNEGDELETHCNVSHYNNGEEHFDLFNQVDQNRIVNGYADKGECQVGSVEGIQTTNYSPGIYEVVGDSITTKNVVIGEGGSVKFFADLNGDGIRQDDEPYIAEEENIEFELKKESDLMKYHLNAGWGLISVPMVMKDLKSSQITTASDMIKNLNNQGLNTTHVTTYRGGKFLIYSERENTKGEVVSFGQDYNILPGEGYFVKNYKPGDIYLKGMKVEGQLPVHVQPGWNLVGLYNEEKSVYGGFEVLDQMKNQSIPADTLTRWDGGTYHNLIIGDGIEFGNDFTVHQNAGYWLKVNKTGDSGGYDYTPE